MQYRSCILSLMLYMSIVYTNTMILGIDEVGRGPWAGPLVMGAVVLGDANIEGLTDSKKLTKKRREELSDEIYEKVSGVGLGWVSAAEIDDIGLSAALCLATKRAVREVKVPFHEIIIDGTINFLDGTPFEKHVTTMAKADLLVPSVSAASIVAKVARDHYMAEQDALYPGYGFKSHVGYGTAAHRAAIDTLGVTPLHRLSFAPLQKYRTIEISDVAADIKPIAKTTRAIGDTSETVASEELVRRGHEIIERNWKTKYCEIDIVSRKGDVVYFTEVKHRRNGKSGDGIAAITPKKLNQMKFAARFYAHTNKLSAVDMGLVAISTTGDEPVVDEYLEIE